MGISNQINVTQANAKYLQKAGDEMSGDLAIADNKKIILDDVDGFGFVLNDQVNLYGFGAGTTVVATVNHFAFVTGDGIDPAAATFGTVTCAYVTCSNNVLLGGVPADPLVRLKVQSFDPGVGIQINATDTSTGGTMLEIMDSEDNRWFVVGDQGNIGFFGKSPTAQQASGANLTNNVTSGGTTDTIADFTSLVVYATDAAVIRNDIFQLARKVKQINDALRLYGLLT